MSGLVVRVQHSLAVKQQGVFDIDINDFTEIVKTNMVLEMLMVKFKER